MPLTDKSKDLLRRCDAIVEDDRRAGVFHDTTAAILRDLINRLPSEPYAPDATPAATRFLPARVEP